MVKPQKAGNRLSRFWKSLGPGLVTGASDDDPSAITTFSQAGAQFGLATLWVAFFIYPVLAVIQEMCARMGLVTGKGLTGVVKAHYPKWVLYILILFSCPAFLLNIGADIAILGSVGNLLFPKIPSFIFSIFFTAFLLFFIIRLTYRKLESVMKYICLGLLVYLIVPFLSHQDPVKIIHHTLRPKIKWDKEFILALTGIVGAIVSPYLFFWQSSMEVENTQSRQYSHRLGRNSFFLMRRDILYGALFAVLIMYFIILTAGTVLYNNHIHNIDSVKDAALALEPLAGKLSYLLFSIGIISTGFII
jgi:NRAMP (natural resistance-associated macrophage protein)-like metal ion transporter